MRFFIILIATLFGVGAFGQEVTNQTQPATNNNNVEVIKAPATLEKKAEAEKVEKLEESKNANEASAAQVKVVATKRFEGYSTQSKYMRTQRTPSAQQQAQMNTAVEDLKKVDAKSFEYNLYKYIAGNHDVKNIKYLDAAEKLKPNNSDVHVQKAAYGIIMQDEKMVKDYLVKLRKSGRLTSEPVDYAKDLLNSVSTNGTLITHGFDDTYGVKYAQLNQQIRKDVNVISLDLLQSKELRDRLESQGYKLPTRTIIDVHYLKEFCAKNQSKNLFISMTLPKEYLKGIQSNIYVNGLTFSYSTSPVDNYATNDYLYQVKFDKALVESASTDKAKELSSNYLPMMLVLYDFYKQKNKTEELKALSQEIDRVAVQCNKYDLVQQMKSAY